MCDLFVIGGGPGGYEAAARAATREGIVAVANMFGGDDRLRYDTIPSVIYTHPEVALAGNAEQELQSQRISYRNSLIPVAYSGRFIIDNPQGAGVVKVLAGSKYGESLGVHALGDSSSEFMIAAAAMLEAERCVPDVAQLVFPHPTVSEAMKEAILRASD